MPINFGSAPRQLSPEESGGTDLFGSLLSGFDAYNTVKKQQATAKQMAEDLLGRQLQNKINAANAKYAEPMAQASLGIRQGELSAMPYKQRLIEAQTQRAQQLANQPFGGMLAGDAKEAYALELLKNKLPGGEDNEVYKRALRAYEAKGTSADILNQYRQGLTQTQGARSLTNLGKLENEQRDILAGFEPGTNRQVPVDPQRQEQLLGQYNLQKQKVVSDTDARKKALFATNIDKTISNIDVDNLVQYGGLANNITKKIEEGKALTGNESESYDKYQKALTGAKLLAKQVRQFYGDSITPTIQEGLASLTDPATWRNNPRIAKLKFKQFTDILKSETQTYRDALRNTNVFESANSNSSEKNDPLGLR